MRNAARGKEEKDVKIVLTSTCDKPRGLPSVSPAIRRKPKTHQQHRYTEQIRLELSTDTSQARRALLRGPPRVQMEGP